MYVRAIHEHPDLDNCLAPATLAGEQLRRFVPMRMRAPAFLQLGRHDDASMDEEELRQTTYASSLADAPFYHHLHMLDISALR